MSATPQGDVAMTAVCARKGCEQCRREGKNDPCCRFEGHRTLCADVECRHAEAEHAPCSRKQYKFPADQFDRRCGECGLYPSSHADVAADAEPCILTREDLLSGPPDMRVNGRCSGCGLDVWKHQREFADEGPARRRKLVQEAVERDRLFVARNVPRTSASKSAIQQFQPDYRACAFCGDAADHGCHVAEVRYFNPGSRDYRPEHLDLLREWEHVSRWRRTFQLHYTMNLVPMCETHHRQFDCHDILLVFNFIRSEFVLVGRVPPNPEAVLPPSHQPGGLYELSYRAVAFRLQRVKERGYGIPDVYDNVDGLYGLSVGASSRVEVDDIGGLDEAEE